MKSTLRYLLQLFIFWMAVFALQRLFFLVYNAGQLEGVSFGHLCLSFIYALKMDAATAAFLMAIPLLLMVTGLFVRRKIFAQMANTITIILIGLVLFLGVADTGLYSNWGSKLNAKALFYILFPGEGVRSVNAVPVWLFTLVFLAEATLCLFVYRKWLRAKMAEPGKIFFAAPVTVLLLALLPLMFRGGFQKYPVGKNDVYYSRHCVLNYAALNSSWNLINLLSHARKAENPYQYYASAEAKKILQQTLAVPCDSTRMIINTPRPNIVLVLMESISAENMMKLGGTEPVMPGLDSLCSESLLFSRFYASGFRTEQGLIALLSSFPAQPTATIQREFGKFEKLACLPRTLADAGYSCNYYYSGDLNFANTSAYLHSSAFTKLLDRDARQWQNCTEWGALDEELFNCHLKEAPTDHAPFFSILMTSTNHEPFDAPVAEYYGGDEEVQRYKNTAHYTDSCVFAYIRQAKQQPWYANTIFIITSDHAHFYPKNRSKSDPERHHIPFLMLGGALHDSCRGSVIETPASQVDVASLLLHQLNLSDSAFTWSRNPLNDCTPGFAFYSFDNGFGWITKEGVVIYDHDLQQMLYSSETAGDAEGLLRQGKAYLQELYEEYLGK